MIKNIFLHLIFFSGCLTAFQSCGSGTTDVTFTIQYDNSATETRIKSAQTSVRMWYKYTALGQQNVVQPAAAVPLCGTLQSDGTSCKSYKWETATNLGDLLTGGQGSVQLTGVPLGQVGTQIAIEFLQKQSDGQYYVVAYYCYTPQGANTALTDSILSDQASKVPATVQSGRTCGDCGSTQSLPSPVTTPCVN